MKFNLPSWRRVGALVAVAALASCASTNFHYSELIGKRHFRAPIDTYDLSILRVDGKETMLRPVYVDPGFRKIIVQGPPGATGGPGLEREFSLDVRACTRYYLVAVRPNKLASEFDVRLEYEEPMTGCTPPAAT